MKNTLPVFKINNQWNPILVSRDQHFIRCTFVQTTGLCRPLDFLHTELGRAGPVVHWFYTTPAQPQTLCIMILGLCAVAQPWNQFHEAPDTEFLCCFQRRHGSVSLRLLPLCGWAVVAPRRIHFTITAKWHLMTVPHLKSLSSSVYDPLYCQRLSTERGVHILLAIHFLRIPMVKYKMI